MGRIIISDASCLIALTKIQKLDLLKQVFSELSVNRPAIHLVILLGLLLGFQQHPCAQNLDFPCDSNFTFYGYDWVDEDWVKIYDSLNVIDFTETEIEIRFWTYTAGHIGLVHEALILRKTANKNTWKAFKYSGFEHGSSKHKTMEEFFSNNELTSLSKREIKHRVTVLLENDILSLEEPTYASLSHITDLRGISSSHGVLYTVEVIAENCAREYGITGLWLSMDILQNVPVISKFNAIRSTFRDIKSKE